MKSCENEVESENIRRERERIISACAVKNVDILRRSYLSLLLCPRPKTQDKTRPSHIDVPLLCVKKDRAYPVTGFIFGHKSN